MLDSISGQRYHPPRPNLDPYQNPAEAETLRQNLEGPSI